MALFGWTVLVFGLGFWAGAALNWLVPVVRSQERQLAAAAEYRAKVEVLIARLEGYLRGVGNGAK